MNSLGHSPRSRLWGGERGKLQPGSHLPGSCRRRDGGGDWQTVTCPWVALVSPPPWESCTDVARQGR